MTENKRFLVLVFVMLTIVLWPRRQASDQYKYQYKNQKQLEVSRAPAATKTSPSTVTSTSTSTASSNSSSLNTMAEILFQFTQNRRSLKELLQDLQSQKPLVVRDANPFTGEMAIVRTREPLPGTRYFHAQYFAGSDQDPFVQHMSFEFQPGPQAMSDAIQTVSGAFHLGAPEVQRDDYILWSLANGYILWIKKMNREDLQSDPFNAYTAADDGTIRVAIEAEIHGPDEDPAN